MTSSPLRNCHFQVEWAGSKTAFTEVSGLSIEIEPIEFRDGSSPEYRPSVIAGQEKTSTIQLKRSIKFGDNEFFTWIQQVRNSEDASEYQRDILISLLNRLHEPVVLWKVRNAFPVGLFYAELNSGESKPAYETLELAHEGIIVEHA